MIDHYKLITVTHKSLNTEDLEHFIVRHNENQELALKLQEIKDALNQEEVLYLATCNRVIYFFYGSSQIDAYNLSSFFKEINPRISEANVTNLDRIIEYFHGNEAINHLFEVASSIDSLVVGEREIFRQFRDAYYFSRENNLSGDNIRLIEQATVRSAKDVYTNTLIGAKPVSVVSLAIQEFLKRSLPKSAKILLIGSGETNSVVGKFLRKHQYNNIVIFNRSLDNAQKLSDELGAEARHLGTLKDYFEGFDCMFTCTSSQDPIITKELFSRIVPKNERKLLIDLSIPNNVDKSVSSLEQVDYISIDSIRQLAAENLEFRSSNIASAKEILDKHLMSFAKLYERRRVEKSLGYLPAEIEKVKDRALNLVFKEQIDSMPEDAQQLISEIASYMEKKCVAVPMKLAKESLL